jgi:hypothetical protein
MTLVRQFRQRTAHRSPRLHSNSAVVADYGKYRYRREEGDGEMTDEQKLLAEQELAAVLKRGGTVLIAGGPGGAYNPALYRDKRLEFLVSTEAERRQLKFALPAHVSAVIVSKFLTFDLQRLIMQQARERNIPVFGVLNSFGAVNRLLFGALNRLQEPQEAPVETIGKVAKGVAGRRTMTVVAPAAPPTPAESSAEESTMPATPQPVTTPPLSTTALPPSAPRPALDSRATDVIAAFAEVEAALSLLRDAVLAVAAESESNKKDAQKLRALQEIMTR